jgi:hypothetical protein
MADLFGTHISIEVKVNKKTSRFSVTILDHGEELDCTKVDANGDNLHAKIVKHISDQIGMTLEEPQLTKKGEMSHRHAAVTFNPLEEEEEGEEGYNPLNDSPSETDPYDVGNFGV